MKKGLLTVLAASLVFVGCQNYDDQFDDLEEKYEWCLNNLDKCEEIAKNGKKYIEQFLDEEREAKITNLVLRRYVDNVKINLIE